jgi:hypothetical protein
MNRSPQRTLSDHLRQLLETVRQALSPRRPAPVPIPLRDEMIRRR